MTLSSQTQEEIKRERHRVSAQRYYARHRERALVAAKKWRAKNPLYWRGRPKKNDLAKQRIRGQRWYAKHKNCAETQAALRKKRHRFYYQHHEKNKVAMALWQQNNREYFTAWYRKDPQARKLKAYAWRKTSNGRTYTCRQRQRRRAKLRTIITTLTTQEWNTILAQHKHSCVYCGSSSKELTKDHVIPISKGGHHTKENIVPACRSCNSKKSNRITFP